MVAFTNKITLALIILMIFSSVECAKPIGNAEEIDQSNAETFKGINQIDLPNSPQESKKSQYFISFSKSSKKCDYKACYYGWVSNYTTSDQIVVKGYPSQQSSDILPVFEYKANSDEDYVIVRHPDLPTVFVDIIQIGCQLFEPNFAENNKKKGKDNFKFVSTDQFKKKSPKNSLVTKPSKFNPAYAASKDSSLDLKDVQTKTSSVQENVATDSQYKIVRRQRFVNLTLPTDSFGEEQQTADMVTNVKIVLDKVGVDSVDQNTLRKLISAFNINNKNNAFTAKQIKQKRQTAKPGKRQFKMNDRPESVRNVTTPVFQPKSNIRNLQTQSVCVPSKQSQITIFNYQKTVFEKIVLGRRLAADIKVTASLSNMDVKFRGVIVFDNFGFLVQKQLFSYFQPITTNQQITFTKEGDFLDEDFQVYLPAPVSFMSVNFNAIVKYEMSFRVYLETQMILQNCAYLFKVGADAGMVIDSEGSATLRAVFIEGGAYIEGTLVDLKTDPSFTIFYDLKYLQYRLYAVWYVYIKAFQFEWGFFWRYYTFWDDWSDKIIISTYTISDGFERKYLIYKT